MERRHTAFGAFVSMMDASQPLDRIVLKDTRQPGLSSELVARVDERGNLVLEGWDRGEWVKERTDDWDYEYWLKVSSEYRNTVLLRLLQERFAGETEFKEWLQAQGIPFEFSSF